MGFAVAYLRGFGMLEPSLRGMVMKTFFSRYSASILVSTALSFSVCSYADYDTLFMDLAQGDELGHYRLGIGETQKGKEGDQVTSMVYLSYLASDDMSKLEGANLGTQEFEVIALGAGGFGYLPDPEKQGGAEFDFEISQTTNDALDYERTAIGMRAQIFLPVVAGFQVNVGANFRPFFLSSDWDDTAKLEFEYQGGLEYAFNWDVAVYAQYRFLGAYLNNDYKLSMAEGTMFGLRARF